jgi:hypothetical protein
MIKKIEFQARLPIKFTDRGKWILASCPILDIHSQGKNKTEAKNNLTEAVSLFFLSCFERGSLDAALKDCGFRSAISIPTTKFKAIPKRDSISVPIPLFIPDSKHTLCHA